MQYAFTTFSLPQASLAELMAEALRFGYDSVEIRLDSHHGHGVELSTSSQARADLRAQIAGSGSGVVCLCSSVRLADPAMLDANLDLARRSIALAAELGTPFVRVFGGPVPDDISRSRAQADLVISLQRLGDFAADHGVVLCLETHDDWSSPQRLADVMKAVQHPDVGLLWDVWHTGRAGGASLADAHRLIAPWIRHVHIHDGRLRLDRLEFLPIGHGDIDHLEILALLSQQGYAGTLSGEWINWEPGDVHLPRERRQMARLEALLSPVVKP